MAGFRPGSFHAALLRFDFDLNLKAARSIRNAEPHWPLFRAVAPGQFLWGYSFHDRKTLFVGTTNEDFEETRKGCNVLEKASFSVTKSNIEAQPIKVTKRPLAGVVTSNADSKITEADLALFPLEFESRNCENGTDTTPKKSNTK